jgi:hypothetical protein
MPKALERLLRIRGLEENQRRLTLESAHARLQSLEQARDAAMKIERRGRAWLAESASSGELADRVAGLVESDAARARVRTLEPRVAAAEIETVRRRCEFLDKRVERRQAATLSEEAAARDLLVSERRSQRNIDEWFLERMHRQADDEKK